MSFVNYSDPSFQSPPMTLKSRFIAMWRKKFNLMKSSTPKHNTTNIRIPSTSCLKNRKVFLSGAYSPATSSSSSLEYYSYGVDGAGAIAAANSDDKVSSAQVDNIFFSTEEELPPYSSLPPIDANDIPANIAVFKELKSLKTTTRNKKSISTSTLSIPVNKYLPHDCRINTNWKQPDSIVITTSCNSCKKSINSYTAGNTRGFWPKHELVNSNISICRDCSEYSHHNYNKKRDPSKYNISKYHIN